MVKEKHLIMLETMSILNEYADYKKEYIIYTAHFKGWNLDKDKIIKYLNEEFSEYEGEDVSNLEIKSIEEVCCYYYRFHDGENAKDEGYKSWVEYLNKEEYKKGYGKVTEVEIKQKREVEQ